MGDLGVMLPVAPAEIVVTMLASFLPFSTVFRLDWRAESARGLSGFRFLSNWSLLAPWATDVS